MNYHNGVYEDLEDNEINVLEKDIIENNNKYLKSQNNTKLKSIDNLTVVSFYKETTNLLRIEPYIERLHQETLKEINNYDMMIVKEAFKKEINFSRIKAPSLLNTIKKYLEKNIKK